MSAEVETEREAWYIGKYPKLKYPSHEVNDGLLAEGELVIMEKLDGGNFRFKFYEGGLLCGTRNHVLHKDGVALPEEDFPKAFRHVLRYLYDIIDFEVLESIEDDLGELWFYGEAMHKHSIDYDAWMGQEPAVDDDVPNFVGFDIYAVEQETWLSWDETVEVYDRLGLTTPRVCERTPVEEFNAETFEIPQSEYRTPDPGAETDFHRLGLAEGVVIRNDHLGMKAKLVHPEFKEVNAEVFGEPKKAQSEASKFVATYCTTARIRKTAHKLVDDPEYEYEALCMEMMRDLPREVLVDIMAEEGWDIITNDIDLDVDTKGEVRNRTSKKCARFLKGSLNSFSQ